MRIRTPPQDQTSLVALLPRVELHLDAEGLPVGTLLPQHHCRCLGPCELIAVAVQTKASGLLRQAVAPLEGRIWLSC